MMRRLGLALCLLIAAPIVTVTLLVWVLGGYDYARWR